MLMKRHFFTEYELDRKYSEFVNHSGLKTAEHVVKQSQKRKKAQPSLRLLKSK